MMSPSYGSETDISSLFADDTAQVEDYESERPLVGSLVNVCTGTTGVSAWMFRRIRADPTKVLFVTDGITKSPLLKVECSLKRIQYERPPCLVDYGELHTSMLKAGWTLLIDSVEGGAMIYYQLTDISKKRLLSLLYTDEYDVALEYNFMSNENYIHMSSAPSLNYNGRMEKSLVGGDIFTHGQVTTAQSTVAVLASVISAHGGSRPVTVIPSGYVFDVY